MGVIGPSPTVGRLVHYRLTDQDVNDVFMAVGSRAAVRAGDVRPAMVVVASRQAPEADLLVELQVFIGPCTLHRNSVGYSVETSGCWFWPPRV